MNCFICSCLFLFKCISKLIHFVPIFFFVIVLKLDFDLTHGLFDCHFNFGGFFFFSASFNLCFLGLTFFILVCLTAFDLPAAFFYFHSAKGNLESAKTLTEKYLMPATAVPKPYCSTSRIQLG